MNSHRRACLTDDSSFLLELKENLPIDFHTNSFLKLKEYFSEYRCDELYLTGTFLDGELKDLLPLTKNMKVWIKTGWNSKLFQNFLAKNGWNYYVPFTIETKEVFFQASSLKGYKLVKDMVLFLNKEGLAFSQIDQAYELVSIKYSSSKKKIRQLIRYYIQVLYNSGILDQWFDDYPKVDEFVEFHYKKIVIEHYRYPK